jgi:2-keto-3-deoxy-L-rhamnonate aldolase RhmA
MAPQSLAKIKNKGKGINKMLTENLRTRMTRGDILAGTFMKTPAYELIEILAMSELDFVCLDAEHAPFDRGRLDACMAVARALKFPVLVRVPDGSQAEILKALDSGATGVVVPHIATPEKATNVAKWSRFGHGGRGYAGSHRWAGYATRKMSDVLAQSEEETIVIAQIEEPEGVDAVDAIAATKGIDGLFVGPADLAVCYGLKDMAAPKVRDAMRTVGIAAKKHGKAFMTFAPNTDSGADLHALGITTFFVASEQAFMLAGAKQVVVGLRGIKPKG